MVALLTGCLDYGQLLHSLRHDHGYHTSGWSSLAKRHRKVSRILGLSGHYHLGLHQYL